MSPLQSADWCIQKHQNTNHYYDSYLPYEFHLRMVVQVYRDFQELALDLRNGILQLDDIEKACWGHDLIEDTRTNYNEVKDKLGESAANIIYAVTNEKGRNRFERGNDKYYEGIRMVRGAEFVKLCDRIANTQYSKMTKSKMFELYKNENPKFLERMGYSDIHELKPMFDYLNSLFL